MLKSLFKGIFCRRPPVDGDRVKELLDKAAQEYLGNRIDSGLKHVLQALEIDPINDKVLESLWKGYSVKGDYIAMVGKLQTIVARYPRFFAAHALLGSAYRKGRMLDEAASSFERSLLLNAADYRSWNELGIVNLDRGRAEDARGNFLRALEISPGLAEAYCNLGIVELDEQRFEHAIAHLRHAIDLAPDLIEAWVNLGLACYGAGRFEDAERIIRQVLEQNPDHKLAKLYFSYWLLARRQWRAGWDGFEFRLEVGPVEKRTPHPLWRGQPLQGRRIVIYGEQGLGDEIMFASCIEDVISSGARCALACDPRLASLLRRSFPDAEILSDRALLQNNLASNDFDYQLPIGSLPKYFRNKDEDFQGCLAYLKACDRHVGFWKERLDGLGSGLKVGISWRGGTLGTRRALRSIPLDNFLPLFDSAQHFVSLQYDECSEEIAAFRVRHGKSIHHWTEAITDYDQTAALVCALDVVVSVCTSVIHLSGALGKKTWVLVPSSPEWRYGFSGRTMPWYPSVELFRQSANSGWDSVMAEISEHLRQLTAQARGL